MSVPPLRPPTGIGARAQHFDEILAARPPAGFLEVHSENFFADGGPQPAYLEHLRAAYPVSLHGVGLSLGSAGGLDDGHLRRLAALVSRADPFLVSEHLSWSRAGGAQLPDLLPLPLTVEAFDVVAANVDRTQETLGRTILVENPSVYLNFEGQEMTEAEFLSALAARTGCGLLLDVNNVYVTACNTGLDAVACIKALPAAAVREIHLGGHRREEDGLLIDTHDARVADAVWDLYETALRHCGDVTSLVEWDAGLPALSVLLDEAAKADAIRQSLRQEKGARHARIA